MAIDLDLISTLKSLPKPPNVNNQDYITAALLYLKNLDAQNGGVGEEVVFGNSAATVSKQQEVINLVTNVLIPALESIENDTGNVNLNIATLKSLIEELKVKLPPTLGQNTSNNSLSVVLASNTSLPSGNNNIGSVSISNFPVTQPISISSIPLATGASTASHQINLNTSVGAITETVPNTDTAASGLNGRLQRLAQRITNIISQLPSALTEGGNFKTAIIESLPTGNNNIGKVSVNNFPSTQAISGSVLVENFPDTQQVLGSVDISNFPTTQAVNVGNFPATQAISGSISVTNFPTTQAVSLASSPLPIDAATSTNQSTLNDLVGDKTEEVPISDLASSGLNGRLQRLAQRLTSLISQLPTSLSGAGNFKTAISEPLPAGNSIIGQVTQSGIWNVNTSGTYSNTTPTLTEGQTAPFQLDPAGNLKTLIVNPLPTGTNTLGSVNQAGSWTVSGTGKFDITPTTPSATTYLPIRITDGTSFKDPTLIRALTSTDVVSAIQSGTWNINNISGVISLPTGAATEATLNVVKTNTDSKSLTATNNVLVLTAANTEYSFSVVNARLIEIYCRSNVVVRYAYTAGKVASSTDPYRTIPAGVSQPIVFPANCQFTGTIYVASSSAGTVIEYEVFS